MIPSRRCTCGYNVFVDRIDRKSTYQSRWRRVVTQGGLGAVPLGVNLGGYGSEGWGRFIVEVVQGALQTICTSCSRVRRSIPVGGGTPLGAWAGQRAAYVLFTDANPSARGCLFGRFERDTGVAFDVAPSKSTDPIPLLSGRPVEARLDLPADAVVADTVYRFDLPPDAPDGAYRFLLRDRCLNATAPMLTMRASAA